LECKKDRQAQEPLNSGYCASNPAEGQATHQALAVMKQVAFAVADRNPPEIDTESPSGRRFPFSLTDIPIYPHITIFERARHEREDMNPTVRNSKVLYLTMMIAVFRQNAVSIVSMNMASAN
jgi:hypothetical protein